MTGDDVAWCRVSLTHNLLYVQWQILDVLNKFLNQYDNRLSNLNNVSSLFPLRLSQKTYSSVSSLTGLKQSIKEALLARMLTGRGLATPIWTLPSMAPFRAWTASSRLAFSRLVVLTYMSRSPGSSLPSCSATPLGTSERITITVLAGSSGSCGG